MSSIVSIKFNDEELDLLRRAHAVSGVAGLSSHIKQVYFHALEPGIDGLEDMRSRLERIEALLARTDLRAAKLPGRECVDHDLLLSIVCGLYVMVRRSVGESIRAQADRALDVAAIEAFLRGR
ncbi:MAG: hypothetical protein REJ50_26055, partial [Bordetella sp.]|nr:hypothetical protein [Bordetella sp.]